MPEETARHIRWRVAARCREGGQLDCRGEQGTSKGHACNRCDGGPNRSAIATESWSDRGGGLVRFGALETISKSEQ